MSAFFGAEEHVLWSFSELTLSAEGHELGTSARFTAAKSGSAGPSK